MNVRKPAEETASRSIRDRIATWRGLLERCGTKATRKRVHALRVVTLRVQAELERDITDLPLASREAQAILRFSKQAEKLRQALSPVREFDVWIGKLRGLRASLTETGYYIPRSMRDSIRGIDRLVERIKKKRDSAEKKLVAEIGKRGGHLVRASEDVNEALSEYVFSEETGIAGELVERFRAVKADFLSFNEENLHEFRKRIKTVRYLAEIYASADQACAQIATQMKKMQSAIGEWHDWQELGLEARGHRGKSKELAELLDTLTAESFDVALSTVHMISANLLGEDAENPESGNVEGGKLPALGDSAALEELQKKLA
jgi:hypothetical protein